MSSKKKSRSTKKSRNAKAQPQPSVKQPTSSSPNLSKSEVKSTTSEKQSLSGVVPQKAERLVSSASEHLDEVMKGDDQPWLYILLAALAYWFVKSGIEAIL